MSDSSKKRSFDETDDDNTFGVRAGKWSTEEESYANRLVYEFERGSLVDCEEGCTLRSYLARKLNCAPMRISKKFAGRCIGKMAFIKRPIDQETLKTSLMQLEELQVKSCRSASNESRKIPNHQGAGNCCAVTRSCIKHQKKSDPMDTSDFCVDDEHLFVHRTKRNSHKSSFSSTISDEHSDKTDGADGNGKAGSFSVCDYVSTTSSTDDSEPVQVALPGDVTIEHFNGFDYGYGGIHRYGLATVESFSNFSEICVDPQEWQDVLTFFSGDTCHDSDNGFICGVEDCFNNHTYYDECNIQEFYLESRDKNRSGKHNCDEETSSCRSVSPSSYDTPEGCCIHQPPTYERSDSLSSCMTDRELTIGFHEQ